ncbi:MAG: GntR family transcriptional regulator [Clostridia bacterium]|jgi:GntR family transcriptional regulator|nr:hypothetical protein [Clostridiales bacterium]MDK2986056.1 GntR family transcriptional regulator [Clostridia bacterium]
MRTLKKIQIGIKWLQNFLEICVLYIIIKVKFVILQKIGERETMQNSIQNLDAMPLHYRIAYELRNKLQKGYWKPGDLFPTDKQLMEQYNVSSTTVRRAIYELVQEGWLERKPGKGTFVRNQMVENLRKLTGFFEEIQSKGMVPSAEIIKSEIVTVDNNLLQEIPLLQDFNVSKVYLIKKIHKMNNTPVVYVKSFWPVDIGTEIAKYDLTKQGVYSIVQDELGILLREASQTISAGLADKEEAEALNIAEKAPILVMNRATYSNERLLEVAVNSYRADLYSYKIILSRNDIKKNAGMVLNA